MKQSTLKKQITEQVAELKGYQYKDTWYCIWQNVLPNGGTRLTPQGFIILGTELGIEFWNITTKDLTLKHLWEFENKLKCPYYIMPKTLVVFDERTAVELSLYQDNLDLYFNN